MTNLILILGLFSLTIFSTSSTKTSSNDLDQPPTHVWITPTGITIDAIYASNWEAYVDAEIAAGHLKYTTHHCQLTDGTQGIYCDKHGPNDCLNSFDCSHCDNCN